MKKSFLWSLLGHIFIILLMVLDLSFGFKKQEPTPPAIMMVDLTKVKISNKTNLPQKAIVQKKKVEPKPQKKVEEKKSVPKPVSSTAALDSSFRRDHRKADRPQPDGLCSANAHESGAYVPIPIAIPKALRLQRTALRCNACGFPYRPSPPPS